MVPPSICQIIWNLKLDLRNTARQPEATVPQKLFSKAQISCTMCIVLSTSITQYTLPKFPSQLHQICVTSTLVVHTVELQSTPPAASQFPQQVLHSVSCTGPSHSVMPKVTRAFSFRRPTPPIHPRYLRHEFVQHPTLPCALLPTWVCITYNSLGHPHIRYVSIIALRTPVSEVKRG